MAADELDLSPEDSERLRELSAALRSEFTANETEQRKSALKDLEDLKSDFLEALRHTVKHSSNESLKTKVAMWGYDKLLEIGKADADPLKKFIEGMEAVTSNSGND